MKKSVSKLMNLSKMLYDSYALDGLDTFLKDFRSSLNFIADSFEGNINEIDSRYKALVSGFLLNLLQNEAEEVIRAQISITNRFVSEKDLNKRIDYLLEDLKIFILEHKSLEIIFSKKVIKIIKDMPIKGLRGVTVESLSERFSYNKDYFSKKFHKEQGMTIQDLITYEKVNRAFVLIKNNDEILIEDLSKMLGFSESKYFRKVFKAKFGFPPSKLKKK